MYFYFFSTLSLVNERLEVVSLGREYCQILTYHYDLYLISSRASRLLRFLNENLFIVRLATPNQFAQF